MAVPKSKKSLATKRSNNRFIFIKKNKSKLYTNFFFKDKAIRGYKTIKNDPRLLKKL